MTVRESALRFRTGPKMKSVRKTPRVSGGPELRTVFCTIRAVKTIVENM